MNHVLIAQIAHEVNRAYCASIGDHSHLPWDELPEQRRAGILKGVEVHVAHPDLTPEEAHNSWLTSMAKDGWTWGEVKDDEKKQHPQFKPFEELPIEQRAKDSIFRALVHQLKDIPDAAPVVAPLTLTVAADGFVPIRYVGHREIYKEGAYGSGIVWAKGETKMVAAELAAKLLKHPDVYQVGEAAASAQVVKPEETDKKKAAEEEAQIMRDQVANYTKATCLEFAKNHYRMDLDPKKTVGELRQAVIGLMDQYGVQP